jgi:fructose-1,6-bisphosphatase/inositol monophosphatase family enzyme
VLGLPIFGSMAVRQNANSETDIVVVNSPMTEITVIAVTGEGLRMVPDRKPRLSAASALLGSSVVGWLQGYGLKGSRLTERLWHDLRMDSRRVLNTWCPSLDLTLLAEGRISGLVGVDIPKPEVYASELIGRESGLCVSRSQLQEVATGGSAELLVMGTRAIVAELESLCQQAVVQSGYLYL